MAGRTACNERFRTHWMDECCGSRCRSRSRSRFGLEVAASLRYSRTPAYKGCWGAGEDFRGCKVSPNFGIWLVMEWGEIGRKKLTPSTRETFESGIGLGRLMVNDTMSTTVLMQRRSRCILRPDIRYEFQKYLLISVSAGSQVERNNLAHWARVEIQLKIEVELLGKAAI